MCQAFYDIRMFGGVLTTGKNAGQVRGPMQMTFAESQSPIYPQSISVTRCAATKDEEKDNKTMGRKAFISYGLYRSHGFYSPHFAAQTGVTQADLELFWESLVKCFEFDRSAARGLMATRRLYVFSHDSKWGNAPTHELFDLLQVSEQTQPPREFSHYNVMFDEGDVPSGVTMTRLA